MSVLERFRRSERGNVATMFAMALVPIFGVIGAAIDYARVTDARAHLVDALDAAVLAVGSQAEMDEEEAFAVINNWVAAHLGDEYAGTWQLDSVKLGDDGSIIASASGKVDTTMARVLGIYDMKIGATSEAVRSLGKVEVALVLDNTGSMKGTKLKELKKAAKALVDLLAESTQDPEDLRIALIPFSQTVRLSADKATLDTYKTSGWIDKDAKSSIHSAIFTKEKVSDIYTGTNRFDLFENMAIDWAGCIESRPYPYDVQEAAPDGTADKLYVPYFAPDEPGGAYSGDYNNSYLSDHKNDKNKNWLAKQGNPAKYSKKVVIDDDETTEELDYQYGPNSGCELEPIVRLTADGSESSLEPIYDAIDDMVAVGNTHINVGLLWGWHALSPTAFFKDGKAYDDKDWNKYVVLMTDGNNQNTDTDSDNKNRSVYSGYGYNWQERFGSKTNDDDTRTEQLDDRLTELCKNMKDAAKSSPNSDPEDDDITIYTVRVEVKTGSAAALKGCASKDDFFYEVADAADLEEEFKDIGGSIQKLRIRK